MEYRGSTLVLALVGLLASGEVRAQWPDKMPALGPEAARGVHDLLVKPGAPTDAFALGFGVKGVEVSVDTLAVVLSEDSGKECRWALGASPGRQVVRERLGGIPVSFQCDPGVSTKTMESLYAELTRALHGEDGLSQVLRQSALPLVDPGELAAPEASGQPQEESTPWHHHGTSVLAGLLGLGIVGWLGRRLRGKGAWKELGLETLTATAALLVPRVGHALYQDLFWSVGQEPWDTTRSELHTVLEGRPADLPEVWGHMGAIAEMGWVLLLGVFAAEAYRRHNPAGTLHRWIPCLVVLGLPMNYVFGSGIWAIGVILAVIAMMVQLGAERLPDNSGSGVGSCAVRGRRDWLEVVLGGLGAAFAIAVPAGLWAGLATFGIWGIWELWRLRVPRRNGVRGWTVVVALLASGLMMVVCRLNWWPSSAAVAAPLDDLVSEGVPLLPVGVLILTGAGYLAARRSWLAAAVLVWAISGLAISAGLPPGASSRLLLASVPASVVLGIAGIHWMGYVVAGRERFLLLAMVVATLVHHHLFQLFMRLPPYTG